VGGGGRRALVIITDKHSPRGETFSTGTDDAQCLRKI
jgi:hypothetical protein